VIIRVRRAYTPETVVEQASIVVERGLIRKVVRGWVEGSDVVDARELIAVPGLVDTHMHGLRGVDVYSGRDSDLEHVSRNLVEFGVTSFLPTSVTLPHDDLKKFVECVASFAESQREGGLEGARVLGSYLEGPYINPEARGAQNPQHIREPSIEEFEELFRASRGTLRVIALAPEIPGALELVARARELGVIPSLGHSAASYEEALRGIEAGIARATHLFNAMKRFHHREPGAPLALLQSRHVFLELIADGIHLHPAVVRFVIEFAGSGRVVLITDSISAAGLGDGDYVLGGLRVLVRGGIARLENGSLAGSTLTLDRAVRNVVSLGIDLSRALEMASRTPARSIGEERVGCLEPGCYADIVLLDAELNVRRVFVGGVEVLSRW